MLSGVCVETGSMHMACATFAMSEPWESPALRSLEVDGFEVVPFFADALPVPSPQVVAAWLGSGVFVTTSHSSGHSWSSSSRFFPAHTRRLNSWNRHEVNASTHPLHRCVPALPGRARRPSWASYTVPAVRGHFVRAESLNTTEKWSKVCSLEGHDGQLNQRTTGRLTPPAFLGRLFG